MNDTKKLISIRKEHECFRLSTKEELENVSFNDIEGSALVYYTKKDDDSCGVIFNPTNRYFNYELNADARILFDNGQCNSSNTNKILVAPYSVIVFKF